MRLLLISCLLFVASMAQTVCNSCSACYSGGICFDYDPTGRLGPVDSAQCIADGNLACDGNVIDLAGVFSIEGDCDVHTAINCVSSANYPAHYGHNEACNINVLQYTRITLAARYDVEPCCDHLHIDGYEVKTPENVNFILDAGNEIGWSTDESVSREGWMICFHTSDEYIATHVVGCMSDGCNVTEKISGLVHLSISGDLESMNEYATIYINDVQQTVCNPSVHCGTFVECGLFEIPDGSIVRVAASQYVNAQCGQNGVAMEVRFGYDSTGTANLLAPEIQRAKLAADYTHVSGVECFVNSGGCFERNTIWECQDRCDSDPLCLMFEMNITSQATQGETPSLCCLEYCSSASTCTNWKDDGMDCEDEVEQYWSSWIKNYPEEPEVYGGMSRWSIDIITDVYDPHTCSVQCDSIGLICIDQEYPESLATARGFEDVVMEAINAYGSGWEDDWFPYGCVNYFGVDSIYARATPSFALDDRFFGGMCTYPYDNHQYCNPIDGASRLFPGSYARLCLCNDVRAEDFFLVSGDCEIFMDRCVTSANFPNAYGPNQACFIEILHDVYISQEMSSMSIEPCCDHLRVNLTNVYSVQDLPDILLAGESVFWSSDQSNSGDGWILCASKQPQNSSLYIRVTGDCRALGECIESTTPERDTTSMSCEATILTNAVININDSAPFHINNTRSALKINGTNIQSSEDAQGLKIYPNEVIAWWAYSESFAPWKLCLHFPSQESSNSTSNASAGTNEDATSQWVLDVELCSFEESTLESNLNITFNEYNDRVSIPALRYNGIFSVKFPERPYFIQLSIGTGNLCIEALTYNATLIGTRFWLQQTCSDDTIYGYKCIQNSTTYWISGAISTCEQSGIVFATDGSRCQFPFEVDGIQYSTCISEVVDDKHHCVTKTNAYGAKSWGQCCCGISALPVYYESTGNFDACSAIVETTKLISFSIQAIPESNPFGSDYYCVSQGGIWLPYNTLLTFEPRTLQSYFPSMSLYYNTDSQFFDAKGMLFESDIPVNISLSDTWQEWNCGEVNENNACNDVREGRLMWFGTYVVSFRTEDFVPPTTSPSTQPSTIPTSPIPSLTPTQSTPTVSPTSPTQTPSTEPTSEPTTAPTSTPTSSPSFEHKVALECPSENGKDIATDIFQDGNFVLSFWSQCTTDLNTVITFLHDTGNDTSILAEGTRFIWKFNQDILFQTEKLEWKPLHNYYSVILTFLKMFSDDPTIVIYIDGARFETYSTFKDQLPTDLIPLEQVQMWTCGATTKNFDYGQVEYMRLERDSGSSFVSDIYDEHKKVFPKESIWLVLIPPLSVVLLLLLMTIISSCTAKSAGTDGPSTMIMLSVTWCALDSITDLQFVYRLYVIRDDYRFFALLCIILAYSATLTAMVRWYWQQLQTPNILSSFLYRNKKFIIGLFVISAMNLSVFQLAYSRIGTALCKRGLFVMPIKTKEKRELMKWKLLFVVLEEVPMFAMQYQLMQSDVDTVTSLTTQFSLFFSLFGIVFHFIHMVTNRPSDVLFWEEIVVVTNPTKDLTLLQSYLTKHFHQDSVICARGTTDEEFNIVFTYPQDENENRFHVRENIIKLLENFASEETRIEFQENLKSPEIMRQVSEMAREVYHLSTTRGDEQLESALSDMISLLENSGHKASRENNESSIFTPNPFLSSPTVHRPGEPSELELTSWNVTEDSENEVDDQLPSVKRKIIQDSCIVGGRDLREAENDQNMDGREFVRVEASVLRDLQADVAANKKSLNRILELLEIAHKKQAETTIDL